MHLKKSDPCNMSEMLVCAMVFEVCVAGPRVMPDTSDVVLRRCMMVWRKTAIISPMHMETKYIELPVQV